MLKGLIEQHKIRKGGIKIYKDILIFFFLKRSYSIFSLMIVGPWRVERDAEVHPLCQFGYFQTYFKQFLHIKVFAKMQHIFLKVFIF